jgi:hypothetical protein
MPTFSVGMDLFDRFGLAAITLDSEAVERMCVCLGKACVFGERGGGGGKTSLEVQEIGLQSEQSLNWMALR